MENAESLIKSRKSKDVSYIVFENRSSTVASVFWHDFDGRKIKFCQLQSSGTYSKYKVKTFVGHPWSAEDSDTGVSLRIDYKPVFYPYSNPNKHAKVYIDDVTKNRDPGSSRGLQSFVESKACPLWVRKKLAK
ncbi:uncharacterized protein LOC134683229 [Mytilus trossulus]|uniref:uncharacterized protein LOC134683229 n=1 Tax=Mytilus trossulus TaxID=6551 RepID=UPI003006A5B8